MLSKPKAMRQMVIPALVIGLVFSTGVSHTFAFNWPWDQGHDSCDPDDPRWGTSPETCDPCCDCKRSPVFVKSGNYLLTFRDFTLAGNGPSVAIGRSYNSRDMRSGPLGRGWTFNYGIQLVPVTDDDGNETTITRLPNGQRIRFTENPDGTFTSPFGVTSTLVRSGDGTYTLTEKNGKRHEFDADGKLTAVVDTNNNQLSFSYDGTGCLNGVTDASGRSFDIAKGVNGKVSTITDPSGRTCNYEYDANGNLIRVTDPLGNTTTFGYDSKDRLTSITDARGNVIRTVVYDDLDRVTSYSEGGETYTMAYLDGRTNKTDSHGNTWQFFYDEMGMVNREIDPLGNEITRQHNSTDPTKYDWEVDANGNRYDYTYDERGNQTSVTDPLGNVTTYTYEATFNKVETKTDPRGVVTKYEYDANGNLTRRTRAFGTPDATSTTYTYDQFGNQTSMSDGNGDTWTYTYDANGNKLTETDPLGNATAYTYDAIGNGLTMTDANGNMTSYQYDAMSRVIAKTDALGNMVQRAYDENGKLVSQTNANANTTLYDYGIYDRPTGATDPLGNVTIRTYDTKGNLASVTDANGKVTYHKYDPLRRRIKTIRKVNDTADTEDADDSVTQYVYDGVGNQIAVTHPNGNTTTYTYDALGRLIAEANPLGESSTYIYDAVGNKLTETLPNGNVVSYTYDNLNRVISITDSVGLLFSYRYDAVGNRLTAQDANGNVTTSQYDASGRLVKRIDAMGEETDFSYDSVGNLLATTDKEGNTVSYTYNAINRGISMTNALGHTTIYQYDSVGNLTRITDANGNATDYEYDAANRLVKETYADGGIRTFTYDGVGGMLSRTDQNGAVTLYEYNDLHFLTKRDYPTDPDDVFTYDKAGRLLTADRGGRQVAFDYDGVNRVTQTTQNGGVIAYAYNTFDRTRSITYPGGRAITERRDSRDRLSTIDDAASPPPIVQYAYDSGNRVISRAYRNGVVTTYSYNANNWILELEHSLGGAPIVSFSYAYDKEGNKLFEEKRHDSTRSEAYQYDAINRLVDYKVGQLAGATVPTPITQTAYNLDPVGNWNSKTTDGVTETRTHNTVNEIATIDAAPIVYDGNGNLTDDGSNTYTYDEENRLIRVARKADGKVMEEYEYDAIGRRVVKVVDPAGANDETRYFYDGWRVIEEQDSTGITQATYVYGSYIDEVLTMNRGGQTYYCHQNNLHSVFALTDANGAAVEGYQYDAYGLQTVFGPGANGVLDFGGDDEIRDVSALGNPYMFTGRRLDSESGLYYYRNRYYSPELGRFQSRDPRGYAAGSLSLYEYVRSSPTGSVDPYGLGVLNINVRQAARLLTKCGSAEYKVQWSITDNTKSGWIIQRLKFEVEVKDCDGNAKTPNTKETEYWEGWQVTNGDIWVGFADPNRWRHNADTFRTANEGDNTKGTIRETGKVKFIQGYNLAVPPWGYTVPQAGALPTVTTAPTGWSNAGALDHSMVVKWNCCCDPHEAEVTSNP